VQFGRKPPGLDYMHELLALAPRGDTLSPPQSPARPLAFVCLLPMHQETLGAEDLAAPPRYSCFHVVISVFEGGTHSRTSHQISLVRARGCQAAAQ